MSFRGNVVWSETPITMRDLENKTQEFPILAKVRMGPEGRTRGAHRKYHLLLIHEWGVQTRILAKNDGGDCISIPLDSRIKLKYDGKLPKQPKFFKRDTFPTTDLVKKFSYPIPVEFLSNQNLLFYDESEKFTPSQFGKGFVTSEHYLKYLCTSEIDESGSIDAETLSAIPDFMSIEIFVASGINGCPLYFLGHLVHTYQQDTKALMAKKSPRNLLKLMGYSISTRKALPHMIKDGGRKDPSTPSVILQPLPPAPDGPFKIDTFKKWWNLKERGAIPFDIGVGTRGGSVSSVPDYPADPIPTAASSASFASPIYDGPVYTNEQDLEDDDSQEDYDEGWTEPIQPPFLETEVPIKPPRKTKNVNNPKPPTKPKPPPKPKFTPVQTGTSVEQLKEPRKVKPHLQADSRTMALTNEFAQFMSVNQLKKTERNQKQKEETGQQDNAVRQQEFQTTAELLRRKVTPVAKIKPSVQARPPLVPPGWNDRSTENQQKYGRNFSDPGSKVIPEPSSRPRYLSEQGENKSLIDGELNITRVTDIPKDLSRLNVQEIGQCLKLLNFDKYIASFAEQQIDGAILTCMGREDFAGAPLNMKGLDVTRMIQFAQNGWRPNLPIS